METYRHSTAHLLAHAVCQLFKNVKLGIGPAIDNGFYYDFQFPQPFSQENLSEIEACMNKLASQNIPIDKLILSKSQARELLLSQNQTYKLQLLDEIDDDEVIFYKQGDFIDLCRGPHVPSTGLLKYFKLTHIAGAYWRGDPRQDMLTRIYGVSFQSQEELDEYLRQKEEAKKRDHRKLAKDLQLCEFFPQYAQGMVFYLPEGVILREILQNFSKKEHIKRGYLPVITPTILKSDLWEISGHIKMNYPMFYTEVDGVSYCIKPMNCPGHILLYRSSLRSYRDLPLRFFELGTVHRAELDGVLHGLLRVRSFTQDDAHIFCTPQQLEEEISNILKFTFSLLKVFGFEEFEVYLSTQPPNYIGSPQLWERSTNTLKEVLSNLSIPYKIDPAEGVFYGPKIDIKLKDALGRLWQGPTIQLDFNLPAQFNLTYVDKDNTQKQVVMIHRVIFGSLERFIGILIEHYGGAFPLWLAPTQIIILPICKRHQHYAEKAKQLAQENDLRAQVDARDETLNFRIVQARHRKIPYVGVVGDREMKDGTISLRKRNSDEIIVLKDIDIISLLKKEESNYQ